MLLGPLLLLSLYFPSQEIHCDQISNILYISVWLHNFLAQYKKMNSFLVLFRKLNILFFSLLIGDNFGLSVVKIVLTVMVATYLVLATCKELSSQCGLNITTSPPWILLSVKDQLDANFFRSWFQDGFDLEFAKTGMRCSLFGRVLY